MHAPPFPPPPSGAIFFGCTLFLYRYSKLVARKAEQNTVTIHDYTVEVRGGGAAMTTPWRSGGEVGFLGGGRLLDNVEWWWERYGWQQGVSGWMRDMGGFGEGVASPLLGGKGPSVVRGTVRCEGTVGGVQGCQ